MKSGSFGCPFRIAVALLLLQLGWVVAAEKPKIDEHLQAAAGYLQSGNLAAAEKSARKAISLDQQSAQAWTLLGIVAERSGRLSEAVQDLQKALALDPDLKLARSHLGAVYYRQGERALAEAEFAAVLRIDANDPVAHFHLGEIRLEAGDYQAALDHLTAVRRATGDDPRVLLPLARCHLGLEQKPEALQLLAAFAADSQANAEALFHAGSLLLAYDEPSLARDYLLQAAELSPNQPAVLLALAEAHSRAGAPREATLTIDRFVNALRTVSLPAPMNARLIDGARRILENARTQLDSAEDDGFLYAELLFLAKDYRSAIEVLNSRKHAFRKDPAYFNLLGMSLAGVNEFEAAGKALGEALRLDPQRSDLLFNLATVYQKAGDNQTAASFFERVLARDAGSPYAHFGLGVSRFNLGKHSEAEGSFRKALEIDPRLQEARIFLGRAQSALGKTEQAIETYRKALALNAACEECRFRLALVILPTDAGEAAKHLREVIQVNPRHAEAHFQLGKLLIPQDATEEAVEKLERAIELDPDFDAAYYQLGRLYAKLGQQEKAKELLGVLSSKKRKRLETYQDKVSSGADTRAEDPAP